MTSILTEVRQAACASGQGHEEETVGRPDLLSRADSAAAEPADALSRMIRIQEIPPRRGSVRYVNDVEQLVAHRPGGIVSHIVRMQMGGRRE